VIFGQVGEGEGRPFGEEQADDDRCLFLLAYPAGDKIRLTWCCEKTGEIDWMSELHVTFPMAE
jgi:hypothetical protein